VIGRHILREMEAADRVSAAAATAGV